MPILTLEQALQIAQGVLAEGRRRDFAPLCCAVLDSGGNVLALLRDEKASIYRPEIATAKAAGCLGMGFGGRELMCRANAAPSFFAGLQTIFPKGILAVPGGVLIKSGEVLLGAVGVSGDTSDNDEIAALAGVAATGLTPDAGARTEPAQ